LNSNNTHLKGGEGETKDKATLKNHTPHPTPMIECRALLIEHGAVFIEYGAILIEYEALLIEYWALLIEFRSLLTEDSNNTHLKGREVKK